MTPLGHQVLKQLILPVTERTIQRRCAEELSDVMRDVHYFDCSAIVAEATALVRRSALDPDDFRSASKIADFLPAANTWIEIKAESGVRYATLLRSKINEPTKVYLFIKTADRFTWASMDDWTIPFGSTGDAEFKREELQRAAHLQQYSEILGCLAFINSPHIIGRRAYPPHKVLQKSLNQAFTDRRFRLFPWTEIVLKATIPSSAGTDAPNALVGARALHFVRTHLRFRLGRLELVGEHWRGDAALGIRRSTYRVKP